MISKTAAAATQVLRLRCKAGISYRSSCMIFEGLSGKLSFNRRNTLSAMALSSSSLSSPVLAGSGFRFHQLLNNFSPSAEGLPRRKSRMTLARLFFFCSEGSCMGWLIAVTDKDAFLKQRYYGQRRKFKRKKTGLPEDAILANVRLWKPDF